MVAQMDNLELQMGVLDANVKELTRSMQSMHQDMRVFFMHQGFFPPSLQPPQN